MRRPAYILAAICCLCGLANCHPWLKRVPLDQEFALLPQEKVRVADTHLQIELRGVGHQWHIDRSPHITFVTMIISGATDAPLNRSLTIGQTAEAGFYEVTLRSAWEDRSEGGPRANFIVSRRKPSNN